MLKEVTPVNQILTSQQMIAGSSSSPIVSLPTNIMYKDSVAYFLSWTGTPTGTFYIQDSLDYRAALAQSPGNAAPSSGTWNSIPNNLLSSTPVASGASGSLRIRLNQMDAPWVRIAFVSTALAAQTVGLVADVSGSLNSKYFLLEDASGANKYYVWFNINSAGVDPAVAGRTGVQITGSTNASAATLGTAVASAVAALNSTNSFTTSGTSTVTITDKVAGPLVIASDGTAATGFTFTATTGSGLLTGLVSGKSLG